VIYQNFDKILFRRLSWQDTITKTSGMRGESLKLRSSSYFSLRRIASSKAKTPFGKASLNALIKIKL
jgi:hypothetical protein